MINFNEKEVLEQLRNNNMENFNLIFEKYYNKVFYFSLKMLKDEYLAEEITQEVFIDVFNCICKLKNLEVFNSWLMKIALNKINGRIKKLVAEKEKSSNNDILEFLESENKNIIPEKSLLDKELNDILLNEISKLNEKKKRVLIMYYFNNLSLKQIAKIENIPVGTVKSRLFSCKKDLEKKMLLKEMTAI